MKNFVDNVLWHEGDLSVLQRIWLEFEEWGLDIKFGIAAENLRHKYEHVKLLVPQQALQGLGKEKGILILVIHQVGMGVTPLHLETLPL
jgi:hypothetical protein